jgi:hypothetical protein
MYMYIYRGAEKSDRAKLSDAQKVDAQNIDTPAPITIGA